MITTKPYQRERAVEYARKWALSRNPLFYDFTGQGGNCTNFVSQCILAGSCVMNRTKDFGWYYISIRDRAPAWSGVEYFYDFMTGVPVFTMENGGIGPYATEVMRTTAIPGDVVQYADEEGNWYHTVIISKIENGEIYVCAQSDDALDRPLSSYNFAAARFLHISGVRYNTDYDDEGYGCFEYLISGGETEPPPEGFPQRPEEQPEPPQEEPETPQEEPETPQEEPETPQEEPETPQEQPETPQEQPETPQEEPETQQEQPETQQEEPVTPQEESETQQEQPETPQEQFEPPQEQPETPQEEPVAPQEEPVAPQEEPVIPQGEAEPLPEENEDTSPPLNIPDFPPEGTDRGD